MSSQTDTLTIKRPDDMHVHLRDGDALKVTVPATAQHFGRAIVMPNLKPPVTTVKQAQAYHDAIMQHVPQGINFTPLMTLYLTPDLNANEIIKGHEIGLVHAVKLYPQGATTHSDSGVKSLASVYPVLEVMERIGVPLLIHGEATESDVDVFDRERVFIEKHLVYIAEKFPALKIVLEHITTQDAVNYVMHARDGIAATITPHHLMFNRTDMLGSGIKPHLYCMPVLKREAHRQSLIAAATSGNPRFFLGTDSAPHLQSTKESSCGCAGVYSAPYALSFYARIFEEAGALDKLQDFSSVYGALFYGLEPSSETITFERHPTIPASVPYLGGELVVLRHYELAN